MGWISGFLSINPCCGCIKLSIATWIVAGLEIVFSATSIVIYILSLATVNNYRTKDAYFNSTMAVFVKFWDVDDDNLRIEDIARRLYQIFGMALFLSIINICVACLLVYAVHSRSTFLVRIWIVFKALGISLCMIYLLTTVFLGQITTIGFLLDLVEILGLLYILWVVYAFMKELVEEEQVLKMSPSIIQTQGKIEVSFPL